MTPLVPRPPAPAAPLATLGALAALGALGCGAPDEPVPTAQPAGWADRVALTEGVDLDPAPDRREYALVAAPGEVHLVEGGVTRLSTYGGALPGPLLRARAGDRLTVQFENQLDVPTTVHWHGVRVPNAMDGVPGHTQPEVPPGGTFEYRFVVPDAGLYWFHPHVDATAQLGSGLYGALLVDDAEPIPELPDQVVLVLSDISLDDAGRLLPPDTGGTASAIFGREGSVLLVNGRVRPTLGAQAGLPQRWRVLNAARSRYFQLELAGHTFTRLGGDGGLAERPSEVARPVLAPGERADLVVVPRGARGARLPLRWIPYDRGYGSTEFRDPEVLLHVAIADAPPSPTPALPAVARAIPEPDAAATPRTLRLTQGGTSAAPTMGIDGVPFDALLEVPLGTREVWTVVNDTAWDHPFHLHGYFFQELDAGGAPREWRDTLGIPRSGTRRIAVHFDERPGMWMFHCHILDHADLGMMGMVQVR